MPPFQHWLAAPAISGAAINIVGMLFGLLGLQSMLSEWPFCALVAVASLVTLYAWWLAARNSFNAEIAKIRSDKEAEKAGERERKLQENIIELLNRLTSVDDQYQPKPAIEDLRPLTSASLRNRVSQLVKRMRAMEQANNDSRNLVLYSKQYDWDQHTSRLIAQSEEQKHRWQSELHPEAMALWQEMQRRIYGAPPYPTDNEHQAVALEYGMLAGVSPLNSAALVLEDLARKVPG